MKFINVIHNGADLAIPISRVRALQWYGGKQVVRTIDDDYYQTEERGLQRKLEDETALAVPAAPGWFRIPIDYDSQCEDDPPFEADLQPVVAWRCTDNEAVPICADDYGGQGSYAVLQPDGSVIRPYVGGRFKTLADFVKEIRKDQREDRRRYLRRKLSKEFAEFG